MLQSMTGYGEVTLENGDLYLHITLKTLNSKYLDIQFNLPRLLSSHENKWRKYLSKYLLRGSVTLDVKYRTKENPLHALIHERLVKACYHTLYRIAQELDTTTDVLGHALDITRNAEYNVARTLTEAEVGIISELIEKAVKKCLESRMKEADELVKQLMSCLEVLRVKLGEVEDHTPKRSSALRARLNEKLALRDSSSTVDTPRWEQEILYYLEKMDIEEEKTRLQSHLVYFERTLQMEGAVGKKLSFIAQEIGRELNTIASKAQDSVLQHMVVDMKQALEQIKEQVQNLV